MQNSYRPFLGITMGDPSGIGPEITVKSFLNRKICEKNRLIVIGDARVIENAVKMQNINLRVNPVLKVCEAKFKHGFIDVLNLNNIDIEKLQLGKVSGMSGRAAYEYIEKVITLALNKQIDATITNPINKESLNIAGFNYSGHTEIYADLTDTVKYTMLLIEGNLRVVHVSTHVSLREACDLVKKDRIIEVIKLAQKACVSIGINSPRIGVAGLNPHSGENGMFGWEEEKEIIPAINAAKELGLFVEGPVPADTLFSKANGGMYDIVVAMYHDQGHIPLKVLGFKYNDKRKTWDSVSGVNITLGLPIIRCSVDHGTAFDQAGKGTASENSLVNAIEYGAALAKNK